MDRNQERYSSGIFWSMDWRAALILAAIGLGLLVLVGVLAWAGMRQVGENAARAWALAATLLLPLAGWVGYRLAHAEARGRLRGIDDGLDRVINAASKAIELRVQNITRTKQATADQPHMVILPPPEAAFSIREALPAGEVVELE